MAGRNSLVLVFGLGVVRSLVAPPYTAYRGLPALRTMTPFPFPSLEKTTCAGPNYNFGEGSTDPSSIPVASDAKPHRQTAITIKQLQQEDEPLQSLHQSVAVGQRRSAILALQFQQRLLLSTAVRRAELSTAAHQLRVAAQWARSSMLEGDKPSLPLQKPVVRRSGHVAVRMKLASVMAVAMAAVAKRTPAYKASLRLFRRRLLPAARRTGFAVAAACAACSHLLASAYSYDVAVRRGL